MNSSSYDLNETTDITQMPESIVQSYSNQPLIATTDIDIINEDKHLLSNDNSAVSTSADQVPFEPPSNITKTHKSLISVYDNSNDGEQQALQKQNKSNPYPLVGILGRNRRSEAFAKRLLLSGFPKPILCDINSTNTESTYVSYEAFSAQSPSIVLLTDNSACIFDPDKQQLIIDAREILPKTPPCDAYRAFGNLSNWEIENGTHRVAVAIEQASPLNLIKFIYDLNCFSRGVYFLDSHSYSNQRIKSFRHCLFPLISTTVVFSLCVIFSLLEDTSDRVDKIYRQASSITASASLTLLALLFLIRPIIEVVETILKKFNHHRNLMSRWLFVQRWLHSRRYLAWYSVSLAILHVIFILLAKHEFINKMIFYPISFGVFSLILLCVLSFAYFPWISERLLWREYHFLTSYLGPFCLLVAFIHVFTHWKYVYDHAIDHKLFFSLKFLSMILPFLVLLSRFLIYGIIHPLTKLVKYQRRTNKTTSKDTALLP